MFQAASIPFFAYYCLHSAGSSFETTWAPTSLFRSDQQIRLSYFLHTVFKGPVQILHHFGMIENKKHGQCMNPFQRNHGTVGIFAPFCPKKSSQKTPVFCRDTVDGQNPAPVDMVNIPLFIGFHTSQVVQDFFHQQYFPAGKGSLFLQDLWQLLASSGFSLCSSAKAP